MSIDRSLIEENSTTAKVKEHLCALLNLGGKIQDRDKFNYREVLDYCQLLNNIYERVSDRLTANRITELEVRAYWIEEIIDVFETEPALLDPTLHEFVREYVCETIAPKLIGRDVQTASLNCQLAIGQKGMKIISGSLELTVLKEIYLPEQLSLISKQESGNNPFSIDSIDLLNAIAAETSSQAESDELLDYIAPLVQLENCNRVFPKNAPDDRSKFWNSYQKILKDLLRMTIKSLKDRGIDRLTLQGELDSDSIDNLTVSEIPEYYGNANKPDLLSNFVEDLFDNSSSNIDTGDAIFEMEIELFENSIKIADCWIESRVKQESKILAGTTIEL